MALSERLQVLLEAVGGASVVGEFAKVGTSAKTEFTTVQAEAAKAEASVAKLEDRLARAKPGSANYDKLSGQLSAARTEADKFTSSAGPLDGLLNSIGLSGAGMGTAVAAGAGLAATAVGVGLVSAVKSGVQSFVDLGTQALNVQRVTGGSAEQVSTFTGILRELGVNSEDAVRPLGLLATNVAQHSAKFAEAGVSIAHYKDGSVDLLGTLDSLRERFNQATDASQKDALAKQLLGRGYQTLIPYLTATNEQINEFKQAVGQHGEILNQGDINSAREYSVEMRELHAAVDQVERDLAQGLVPIITTVAKDLDQLLSPIDNVIKGLGGIGSVGRSIGGGVGDTFKGLVPGLNQASAASDLVQGHFGDAANAASGLGGAVSGLTAGSKGAAQGQIDLSGAAGTAGFSLQAAAGASGDYTSALQDQLVTDQSAAQAKTQLVSAAKGLESAQRAVAQSARSEADAEHNVQKAQEGVVTAHENAIKAQERLGDAQRNLDELMAKGAVDAAQVASAEKSLQSATEGVARAQQSLADAQDSLNKALAGASADELTDSQLALQRATLGVAQAQQQVNQANAPHAGRTGLQEAEAQLSLAEAIQHQKEAQEALDATKAKGTAQDPAVISAQRQVADATRSLTDAIRNQVDAAAALRTAQAGDPEFDDKVAAAKRGVRDAAESVAQAQRGERDAAYAVRQAQQGVTDAKDNQKRASDDLTTANYELRNAMDALNSSGAGTVGVFDAIIAEYPALSSVLYNIEQQVADGIALWDSWDHSAGGAMPASQRPGFAEGGWVPGAPGEAIPAVVHGGEFVLSRDMLQNLRATPPSGVRTAGGQTLVVNVSVAGTVVAEQELTEVIFRALTKAGGRYSALRN